MASLPSCREQSAHSLSHRHLLSQPGLPRAAPLSPHPSWGAIPWDIPMRTVYPRAPYQVGQRLFRLHTASFCLVLPPLLPGVGPPASPAPRLHGGLCFWRAQPRQTPLLLGAPVGPWLAFVKHPEFFHPDLCFSVAPWLVLVPHSQGCSMAESGKEGHPCCSSSISSSRSPVGPALWDPPRGDTVMEAASPSAPLPQPQNWHPSAACMTFL